MYYEFFHLKEHPFRLTCDTRFFYTSPEHAHALAMMEFCLIKKQGLMVLTGNQGNGKSMLLQHFLSRLDKAYQILKLDNSAISEIDFLHLLADAIGQDAPGASRRALLETIQSTLRNRPQQSVQLIIVVDDAHLYDQAVLLMLAELSQWQHDKQPLISIYLVGANQLQDTISQKPFANILHTAYCQHKLGELISKEIKNYILHRLMVAAGHKTVKLDDEVFSMIETYTGGCPRQINILTDHVLTNAYLAEEPKLSPKTVESAVSELQWLPYGFSKSDLALPKTESAFLTDRRQSYKVIISIKGQQQSEFYLNKKRITIGRHSTNDISIDDPLISRVHAQIIRQGRMYYIRDMDSKNGTFVDNKRIDIAQLRENLQVRLGDCLLTFVRQGKMAARSSIL